ncbi:MAG TPA: hypothetical protein VEW03_14000, partial [Longimicrobiaceae bacterium]|nr:hypothetical protein [Longimicrobiaceae bacterium]
MHALRTLAAAVAAGLTPSACASTGGAAPGGTDRPAPRAQTTVRVENHNWQDVVVYVVGSGVRTRLGDGDQHEQHG